MQHYKTMILTLLVALCSGCSAEIKDTSELLANLTKPSNLPSEVRMMVYADERININLKNKS